MARRSLVSNSTTLQVAELPGVDLDFSETTSTMKGVVNKQFTKISKNKHEIKNFLVRREGVGAYGVPPPPDPSANECLCLPLWKVSLRTWLHVTVHKWRCHVLLLMETVIPWCNEINDRPHIPCAEQVSCWKYGVTSFLGFLTFLLYIFSEKKDQFPGWQ